VRSTHVPEQLVSPLGHWHAPAKHCVPPAHWVPQEPQLFGSDWVSVQPMLHAVRPVEQAAVHTLDEQTCVPMHFVAHAPQLSGSFVVSTQAPEQSTLGGVQAALPPAPVPVVVVVAPPVPVVVPPVPVVVVAAVPVVVVVAVPVVVPPPELLPQASVIPARSDAQRSQEARDR
jgi:hypothetical protein